MSFETQRDDAVDFIPQCKIRFLKFQISQCESNDEVKLLIKQLTMRNRCINGINKHAKNKK